MLQLEKKTATETMKGLRGKGQGYGQGGEYLYHKSHCRGDG
jgi:hypothetical protein